MSLSRHIIKTTTTSIIPILIRPKPIYVIVATSLNPHMGIGHKGKLPWPPIKADMTFFRNVSSRVPSEPEADSDLTNSKTRARTRTVNAVVMGRKTWESIPPKFRPLAGRLNVIITRGDSLELGRRIVDELKAAAKANSKAEAGTGTWDVRELAFPATSKPRSKSKSQRAREGVGGPSTIVTLRPSQQAHAQTQAPILISPSLPLTLSLLSSPTAIPLTSSTPTSAPSSANADSVPDKLSIHEIFCIGGSDIYRQVLSLSTTTPRTPTNATHSETDTEGEADGELTFDVRILQTQIRARGEGDGFECDTFFPDALPADQGIKSSKWRAVGEGRVREWVGGVALPQDGGGKRRASVGNEEEDGGEAEKWFHDEKAGVEIRVVGWERR